MDPVAPLAIAGAATLALGGLLAFRASLSVACAVQSGGVALLGAAGVAVLAGADDAGAGFRSDIAPALGIDGLTAFFLVLLAITAIPSLIFASAYLRDREAARTLSALTAAFVVVLALVVCARDVVSFLAGWELMTLLPAAAILVARRDEPVRAAVFLYVAITHLGGAGVWVALLVLAMHGALGDPAALAQDGAGLQALIAVAALIGFGTKAGLVPLHRWLPRAHPVAPAQLSALMSGLMIKVALYGLIRVEFEWIGAPPLWLGLTVLAVALASALGGAIGAVLQPDLKRVLAWSSIENVGIVVLALGASLSFASAGNATWSTIAFAAALLHLANHAVFKTLLFLGAGALERAVGALDLDALGGLLARMPKTAGAIGIGMLAIAGVPPLNGFASEWLALQSLLHLALDDSLGVALAGAIALAGLAATAALALVCFAGVAGLVLLGPPRRPECAAAVEAPAAMRAALWLLAAACVVLGLVPGLVLPTLAELAPGDAAPVATAPGLDVPATGGLPALWIALLLAGLVAALLRARGTRSAATAPTWVCGRMPDPALAWSAAGASKPLRLMLASALRPERDVAHEHDDSGRLRALRYTGHVVRSPIERWLYEPTIRGGLRGARAARRLQTGNVRTYAAYLLALVLALLALARSGALG